MITCSSDVYVQRIQREYRIVQRDCIKRASERDGDDTFLMKPNPMEAVDQGETALIEFMCVYIPHS